MGFVNTFRLDHHSLRSTAFYDRELIERWTAEQPEMQRIKPEFWLIQKQGIETYVAEDPFGPIAFIKVVHNPPHRELDLGAHNFIELHLLFAPKTEPARARRTTEAMMKIFPWIEKALAFGEKRAVFFKTTNPGLIRFAENRLGFKQMGWDDRREIVMLKYL